MSATGANGLTTGLTFTPETFETSMSAPIWAAPAFEVPIPAVPGLFAFVAPSVTLGTGSVQNHKEGSSTTPASVAGNVSIGFSYGTQQVAALTGSLNASAAGAFEYKRGPGEARKLAGSLSLSSAFSIGAKVAGGLFNYNFEFGQVAPIATFGSLVWENGKFTRTGFEWGPRVKEFFGLLKKTIDRGTRVVQGGVDAVNGASRAVVRTIRNATDFADDAWDKVTSW